MNRLQTPDSRVQTDLQPGARNAIRVCLNVQRHEHVTLIADRNAGDIANALRQEIDDIGAPVQSFVLEDLASRPLTTVPAPVAEALERSQVSIFAASAQPHELPFRMAMTDIVNRRRIRHAHMVNITPEIMRQGMRADFAKVDALSRRVLEIVSSATHIRATSRGGSNLTAALTPAYKWIKTSGLISPEKWGNLPGGEVFTTPLEVNGTFVVDGVVGDWLCERYGLLDAAPLTLTIERNRLVGASSSNTSLERDFWTYTHTDENSDRVGEFAIGTNIELHSVIGNILQDEKFPGLHIAFGNPYGAHTGADWFSRTHIDVVGLNFDIWADERQIMREGAFII